MGRKRCSKARSRHVPTNLTTYIRIDTLCIDESSSAELSEAIHSMFKWYECSAVCYAYLFDITGGEGGSILGCKWLTRGGTLQELIAPERVRFYDMRWRFIGTGNSLAEDLESITEINYALLYNFENAKGYDPRGLLDRWASRPEMKTRKILASISAACSGLQRARPPVWKMSPIASWNYSTFTCLYCLAKAKRLFYDCRRRSSRSLRTHPSWPTRPTSMPSPLARWLRARPASR